MNSYNPTSNHRARRSGRGFSLIEVITVITIMAIVGLLAVPALSQAQTTRQRIACRTLARDMAYARERSIATGTRHWVVVNTSTDVYTMFIENPANPGRANRVAMTDPSTAKAFSQAFNAGDFAGVDIVSASIGGSNEVGFDWMGRPLSSAETLITTAGTVSLSGSQSVSIEPGTGLVSTSP